jgi:hypothetical protein
VNPGTAPPAGPLRLPGRQEQHPRAEPGLVILPYLDHTFLFRLTHHSMQCDRPNERAFDFDA